MVNSMPAPVLGKSQKHVNKKQMLHLPNVIDVKASNGSLSKKKCLSSEAAKRHLNSQWLQRHVWSAPQRSRVGEREHVLPWQRARCCMKGESPVVQDVGGMRHWYCRLLLLAGLGSTYSYGTLLAAQNLTDFSAAFNWTLMLLHSQLIRSAYVSSAFSLQ